MSVEVLRRAASLMRERATAVPVGPWEKEFSDVIRTDVPFGRSGYLIAESTTVERAEHIASWHPAVALAVAKAMDDCAQAWEISDGWVRDLDDDAIRFEDTVDGGWLTVARAYLKEES